MLAERFEAERGYLYRSAPLPPELRRVAVEAATAASTTPISWAPRSATC